MDQPANSRSQYEYDNTKAKLRSNIGRRSRSTYILAIIAIFVQFTFAVDTMAQGSSSKAAQIREAKANFKKAVALAGKDLQQDDHSKEGVLVFCVRSKDGKMGLSRTRLYNTTHGIGGFRPGRISEYETVTMFGRHNKKFELRINAPGYHEFIRSGIFQKGKIISWYDIILDPVTRKTAGVIEGVIHLEDSSSLGGIKITVTGYPPVETDRSGHFRIVGVGAGNQRVSATKTGYFGLYQSVLVTRGETVSCELEGFKRRTAQVRWSYQPEDSSRNLVSHVTSGTSVLSPTGLNRVSFAGGFIQVGAYSDFYLRQDKDQLIIKNFDQRFQGPGILHLHGISFDKVTEAPQAEYATSPKIMRKGDVYVLRTYDGKHYAKMEVLQLFDGLSVGETVSLSLSSICQFPPPQPSDGPLPSIAVLDLDAGDNVSDDIIQALSDLVRSVIQDTGRYLVVDRDSIIQILGEEDFMSTVKCDNTRCLVNYGKKLRAQKIVHGRVSLIGKTFIVSIKLLDVSSAKVDAFKTNRTSEGVDSLLDLIEPQTCELIRATFP